MSTRGAVAWKVNTFVLGVYNHYDSYPTKLGKKVWDHIVELGANGLITRLRQYGDWEEFENCGVCKYCGKVAGQPQDITMDGPDPEAKYHSHGNSSRDQIQPFENALMVEWVYLIDEAFETLEVWFSIPADDLYKYRGMGMIDSDIIDANGYTHILLKSFSRRDDEPNWAYLEHEAQILKRGTDDGF